MIDIRPARSTDEDQIRIFLHQFFGNRATTKYPHRWKWQLVDNPFIPDGFPRAFIALEDNRIVGQLALQYTPLWIWGNTRPCAWGVDFGVLQTFRGRGLGIRLQEMASQSVTLLLSALMDKSAARIKQRLNFQCGRPVHRLIRFTHISKSDLLRFSSAKLSPRGGSWKVAANLFSTCPGASFLLASCLNATNAIYSSMRHRFPIDNNGVVEEFENFGQDIDDLWENARNDYRMTTARTSEYLNWRYVRCPGISYRKFRLRQGRSILGYIVIRERLAPEFRSVRIVDVFSHRSDGSTVQTLVHYLLTRANIPTAFFEFASSEPLVCSAFRRLGFIQVGVQTPTAGGIDAGSASFREALKDWYVTMGDHDWDQFRPVDPVYPSASDLFSETHTQLV